MSAIQVGDKLPAATLRRLTADGIQEVSPPEFCAGRKVVLFGVPGAFTGTCTKQHLPSYLEQADALRAKGIDEIACVAVNDVFVLDAWSKSAGADGRVTMLSDGNAEFVRAIGLSMDGSAFGMGTRSMRFAMVVEDGAVQTLHVEESPGTCSVTAAPSLLEAL